MPNQAVLSPRGHVRRTLTLLDSQLNGASTVTINGYIIKIRPQRWRGIPGPLAFISFSGNRPTTKINILFIYKQLTNSVVKLTSFDLVSRLTQVVFYYSLIAMYKECYYQKLHIE